MVDGTTINDPANRQVQTSYGSFQSMFVVPGPDPWLPAAGVARGAIARHAFHSTIANDDRDYFVYLPARLRCTARAAVPGDLLLHGLGDDAERWMNGGAANVILDNLIAGDKAVPMVIVTTLGYGVNNGPAGAMAPESITGYTKSLLTEVMPAVDAGTTSAGIVRSAPSPACRWEAPRRSTRRSTISTSSRGLAPSAARS